MNCPLLFVYTVCALLRLAGNQSRVCPALSYCQQVLYCIGSRSTVILNAVSGRNSNLYKRMTLLCRCLPFLNRQCVSPLWNRHHTCWLDLLHLGCYLYLALLNGLIYHPICVQGVSKYQSVYCRLIWFFILRPAEPCFSLFEQILGSVSAAVHLLFLLAARHCAEYDMAAVVGQRVCRLFLIYLFIQSMFMLICPIMSKKHTEE